MLRGPLAPSVVLGRPAGGRLPTLRKPQGSIAATGDGSLASTLVSRSSRTVGRLMEPRARQIANGNARYDHASDFLHALLRDLGQKVQ
jgi:hypothetical protein